MDFVSQLSNSVAYSLHQATYSPEAEAYAKESVVKKDAAETAAAAAEAKAKADAAAKETAKKAAEAAAAAKQAEAERATFSPMRLASKILGYLFVTVLIVGCIALACVGASYATNLNVYRPLPQRLFYAVYGFAFWIPVVLYCGLYREWWQQKPSIRYAGLPLFDQPFESPFLQTVFGWTTFAPDERVRDLEEWKFIS
jgi:hypothetical protein